MPTHETNDEAIANLVEQELGGRPISPPAACSPPLPNWDGQPHG